MDLNYIPDIDKEKYFLTVEQKHYYDAYNKFINRDDIVKDIVALVDSDIGKVTQVSGVDADDGNFFVGHSLCRAQKCAVAAYAEGNVGRKTVALDKLVDMWSCVKHSAQVVIESIFHSHFEVIV